MALFALDLLTGTSQLTILEIWQIIFNPSEADSMSRTILFDVRLVKAFTAIIAGGALGLSGLQMQTLFRNPLAGPYVLGVSSGASLGVALLILASGSMHWPPIIADIGIIGASWLGSTVTLLLISLLALKLKDIMAVLVLGVMLSSGIGAIVQILQYASRNEALKEYVVWTMGSLGEVTYSRLWILAITVGAGIFISLFTIKPLNIMAFGEEYARSMGLKVKRSRNVLFLTTVLLSGGVTAFCGPIGFVGLAVPHIAAAIFHTPDHRWLMPSSLVVGAILMLICDIVAKTALIPINAVASLLGIPVVVWIVVSRKKFS